MRRTRAAVAAIVVAASLVIGALLVATWPRPLPELAPAAESGELALTVGESADAGADRPLSVALAAHPTDPKRLFLAAAHETDAGPGKPGVAGYASADGGLTWTLAFDRLPGRPDEWLDSPTLAFGPDGELYFACTRSFGKGVRSLKPGEMALPPPDTVTVDVAVSADGGTTWEDRAGVDTHLNSPRLAVDRTAGPNRGRLYLGGSFGGCRAELFYSTDGGRLFSTASQARPVESSRPNSPLVLPGGEVIAAFAEFAPRLPAQLRVAVLHSADGGQTFERSWLQTEFRHDRYRSNPGYGTAGPALAADPNSGRAVCAWGDGEPQDGHCVLAASSPDGGKTWADPASVSEQGLRAGDPDWIAECPAAAFSARGVVAVAWYDRRRLPPSTVGPGGAMTTTGYNVRLRASSDGGKAWCKSVRVNAAPGLGDLGDVRNGLALAADAAGRFHVAWLSDAAGPMRLFTATVEAEAGGD